MVVKHEGMRNSRVFKSFASLNNPLRQQFIDATTTARAAGYRLQLRVETGFLRKYFIPTSPDDHGLALISSVVEEMYLALNEKNQALRVSHGAWLSLHFDLVAQHRRKNLPEILHLQVLLGPCTSDQCSVFVWRAERPVPFEGPPF